MHIQHHYVWSKTWNAESTVNLSQLPTFSHVTVSMLV